MRVATRPPRFLISRLSAIGDCILTMPVACALRQHFPQAFVAWVVEPLAAPLLKGHPCLDEVVVAPRGWWKSPQALWRLRGKLQSLQIDTTLDVQSLTKSGLAARLSGARRRIGFRGEMGRELSPSLNNLHVTATEAHVVDCFLQLLVPLGIERPAVRFDIPRDPQADASVAGLISRAGAQEFAVMNPGAGWASKLWPVERYAQVAAWLGQQRGISTLVVWHGGQERDWAEQIVAQSQGQARLAPRTNLLELAALLREAALFLGSDSSPLHLAAAVGTPCIGLIGPTRAERCGPYGERNISLQAYYQSGTNRQRRSADNLAMQAISAESVRQACDRLLDRAEAAAPKLSLRSLRFRPWRQEQEDVGLRRRAA